jgi:Tfp pilus assembly protein PilZ
MIHFRKRKRLLEKRKTKRVAFRNTVLYGQSPDKPHQYTSFVADLSGNGIGIKTYRAFKPGTRLYLIIKAADKSYDAEGAVVWAKRVTPGLLQFVKTGMGIKFTHVDPELVDIYEKKLKAERIENTK